MSQQGLHFFSARISNSNRGKRSLNMLLPIAWFNLKILSPYFFKEKWFFQMKLLSSFEGQKRKGKLNLFTISNPARFLEDGQKNCESFTRRLKIQFGLNWKHCLFPPFQTCVRADLALLGAVLLTFLVPSSDNFTFIKKGSEKKGTC